MDDVFFFIKRVRFISRARALLKRSTKAHARRCPAAAWRLSETECGHLWLAGSSLPYINNNSYNEI